MSAVARWGTAWPATRAGLLALVLFVEGITALPIPHGVQKRALSEEPVATEEIEAQRVLLAEVGIHVTHAQLVDWAFASGTLWSSGYDAVMKPFNTLFRVLGIGQSWGLFTYPDTFPHQLVVEVRRSHTGPWERLYAGLDPDHAWKHDILTYRRIRGVYDGQTDKPGPSWNNLTRWLAARACGEDPDVAFVRVSFRRFHTVRPDAPADSSAEVERQARVWSREQVLP